MSNYSERIEQLRETLGVKGKEFAEQIGLPYRSYMNYKGGRTPPAEVLSKILEVFDDVNPAWLMVGDGNMFLEHVGIIPDEDREELSESEMPEQADSDSESASHDDDEDVQTRMMRHVMDLHEENRELRDRIEQLEIQLQKSRSKVRKLNREFY